MDDACLFQAFLDVAAQWALTDDQCRALLGAPESTFKRWKEKGPLLRGSERERIALISSIYLGLHSIFGHGNEVIANGWIKTANVDFNNRPPLDLALTGGITALLRIAAYIANAQ